MNVAELTATLNAEVGSFMTNMKAADAAVGSLRGDLATLTTTSKAASDSLNQIKLDSSQTAATRAMAAEMKKAIDSIATSAIAAQKEVDDLGFQNSQVAKFIADSDVMKTELDEIALKARATNAALSDMEIKQRRDPSTGQFTSGRMFVSGTPQSASYVRGVDASFADATKKAWRDIQNSITRGPFAMGPANTGIPNQDMRLLQLFEDRAKAMSAIPNRDLRDSSVIGSLAREIERGSGGGGGDSSLRAIRAAAGGGGGGGGLIGGGALSGILPGGARPGPAAIALLAGLAAATGPAIVPGVVGGGLGLAAAAEGMVGAAATLKLAFSGITSAAFTTQKAFNALTPIQQTFVQHLRQLDAGLMTNLENIAQNKVLPGLTSAIGAAVTPASVSTLTEAVNGFSNAIDKAAGKWASLLGSSGFNQAFSSVIQADARYVGDFVGGLANLFDAFIHVQQAAQPFTDWMDKGLLGLTQWADNSAKAAQASGFFTNFLNQAKEGLQAIGGLLGSVGHLFLALNDATGIGVAVGVINTLKNAIGALASFIEQNQKVFRDFLTGAVQSANDLISAIKRVLQAVSPLLQELNRVANALGGWRIVIDGLVTFWISKFLLMKASVLAVGTASKEAAAAVTINMRAAAGVTTLAMGEAGAAGTIATALGRLKSFSTGLLAMAGKTFTIAIVADIIANMLPQGQGNNPLSGVPILGQAFGFGQWLGQQITGTPSGTANVGTPATLGSKGLVQLPDGQWVHAGSPAAIKAGVSAPTNWAGSGVQGSASMYGGTPTAYSQAGVPNSGGTYVSPVKPGTPVRRPDQGLDYQGKPGDFVVAIGNAHIDFAGTGVSGFGGYVVYTLKDGPSAGQQIYVGHAMPLVKTGDDVAVGTPVAQLLQSGMGNAKGLPGWTEIGFASGLNPSDPSGKQGLGGAQFKAFLSGQPSSGFNGYSPGTNPYGTPDALTADPSTTNSLAKAGFGLGNQGRLTSARTAFLQGTQAGNSPLQDLKAAGAYLDTLQKMYAAITGEIDKHAKGTKAYNTLLAEQQRIQQQINSAVKEAGSASKAYGQAQQGAAEMKILGLDPSGGQISSTVATLRTSLNKIKAEVKASPFLDTASVKQQINQLNEVLKNTFIPPEVRAAVEAKLGSLQATIKEHLSAVVASQKQALTDAVQQLDQVVQQLIAAANTAFDQQTQNQVKIMTDAVNDSVQAQQYALTDELQQRSYALSDQVKAMNDQLADDLKNMQVMVVSAAGNFMFGGSIKTTPAEDALKALQDAHDQQQQQFALTAAQQGLVTANATGDPQKMLDARRALADAQYNIQVYGLQQQATTQKDAATDQLQQAQQAYQDQQQLVIEAYQRQQETANTAYERQQQRQIQAFQDLYQGRIQAYQDQRALQKQAMDNQLADFELLMKEYPQDAGFYLNQMLGVFQDNGILGDMYNNGLVVGGTVYSGLADGLNPIFTLIGNVMSALTTLQATQAAAGLPITDSGSGPGVPDVSSDGGGAYTSAQVAVINAAYVAAGLPGRVTETGGGAYYTSNQGKYGKKPIPMASGGAGIAYSPTLFMAGEAGPEEFSFSPVGHGSQTVQIVSPIVIDGKQVAVVVRKHLLRLGRQQDSIFGGLA